MSGPNHKLVAQLLRAGMSSNGTSGAELVRALNAAGHQLDKSSLSRWLKPDRSVPARMIPALLEILDLSVLDRWEFYKARTPALAEVVSKRLTEPADVVSWLALIYEGSPELALSKLD